MFCIFILYRSKLTVVGAVSSHKDVTVQFTFRLSRLKYSKVNVSNYFI